MSEEAKENEPSMDEILSSIRQIISEDGDGSVVEGDSNAEAASEDEMIELTEVVEEDGTIKDLKEEAVEEPAKEEGGVEEQAPEEEVVEESVAEEPAESAPVEEETLAEEPEAVEAEPLQESEAPPKVEEENQEILESAEEVSQDQAEDQADEQEMTDNSEEEIEIIQDAKPLDLKAAMASALADDDSEEELAPAEDDEDYGAPVVEVQKEEPSVTATQEPVIEEASAEAVQDDNPTMLSDEGVVSKAGSAFADLSKTVESQVVQSVSIGASGMTLEQMTMQLLKPMLKEWLDNNLASVVENVVKEEVERISHQARRKD